MNSMAKPSKISELTNGLRLAASVIVGFVVGSMFFGGIVAMLFPTSPNRSSSLGPYSVLALLFLLISVPVMFLTMERWLKVMAAILGLGVLNGGLTVITGHVLANPAKPVSRMDALALTLFFVLAAILAGMLKDQELTFLCRSSIMIFLFTLACWLGYRSKRPLSNPLTWTDFGLMASGLIVLLFARVYRHFQTRARA